MHEALHLGVGAADECVVIAVSRAIFRNQVSLAPMAERQRAPERGRTHVEKSSIDS